MGIAASDFLCPNLATFCRLLRFPESWAGITFLALGNGSPDLFSAFAAMRVGSESLAIGELTGAALFITTVVAGSMAIVNPFKVSRISFLRDSVFFFGAVALSFSLLADGEVTTWKTSCLILYYIVYVVCVVVVTWHFGKRLTQRRADELAIQGFQGLDEENEVDEDETEVEEDDDADMEQLYAHLRPRTGGVRPNTDGTTLASQSNQSNIRPSLLGALEVLPEF